MNLSKMNPAELDKALAAAEREAKAAQAAATKLRAEDDARANNAAAEEARRAEEARVEQARRDEISRQAERAAAELERARRAVEDRRKAELIDSIEKSGAAVTLLQRAYAEADEFGDLDNALRGGAVWADQNKRGQLEGRRAMRTFLGLDVPSELWISENGGLTAKLYGFLGVNWAAGFSVGEGPFLMVEIPGHGAWNAVYGLGTLAELCERFPSLRTAMSARPGAEAS